MRSKKRFTAAAGAAAMALTLALSACGGGGSRSDDALTLGALLAPSTFAANNANWGNEAPYLQAVYDTLVRETPDAQIVPWLATSWEYDPSKTVLTMTLRDDVTFTDGTKFDADVAAQNLLRFRDGASPNRSYLDTVADARGIDPTTLQITLTEPNPSLLYYLAQNAGLMSSPKAFGAADEKTNPVGSGPYVLDTKATVAGSKYVFTKNPGYWAQDDQHYESVNINVYAVQAAVNAMQGGQIDGALIDADSVGQVEAAGYEVKREQNDWTGLILFDRNGALNPALGDVRVRQAINHAIDRDALLQAVQGYGTVTGQIFGKNNPAYVPELDTAYSYDPAKAKQLLTEAGFANGFTLSIPLVQELGAASQFDLLKQYLADIGVTVDYVTVPLNNLIAELTSGKFAASRMSLIQDPTAWQTANLEIAPDAAWNPFRVGDPKIDGLLDIIQSGSDEEAAAAAKELNQFVVEQAWFTPFYRVDRLYGVSQNTDITLQSDNAAPYLYNIKPKA
ncbi:ABC transporter substrate-binding protein [Rhodococcus sp. C26F]